MTAGLIGVHDNGSRLARQLLNLAHLPAPLWYSERQDNVFVVSYGITYLRLLYLSAPPLRSFGSNSLPIAPYGRREDYGLAT